MWSLRQVRSLKVVIGDPINLPVVNATNRIVRLFDGTIRETILGLQTFVLDQTRGV